MARKSKVEERIEARLAVLEEELNLVEGAIQGRLDQKRGIITEANALKALLEDDDQEEEGEDGEE